MYRNKILVLQIILLVLFGITEAQNNPSDSPKFIRITPVFQKWNLDSLPDFSEMSTMVFLVYPISPDLSISSRFGRADVGGDVSNLGGFTDLQTQLSYYMSDYQSVLHMALNFPAGKNNLSPEQFNTSVLMSQNLFGLQYPNLGQGFNISLGASRALQIRESTVVGFGASYQIKRKYQPVRDFGVYDPGNEFLLTMGTDYRLNETARFTADLIYTRFGSDKLDGQKIVSSGNRFLLSFLYRKYIRFDELNLKLIYRIHPDNRYYFPGQSGGQPEKINPNLLEISGSYRFRMGRRLYMKGSLDGYISQTSLSFVSGARMLGLGVAPEIRLNPEITVLTVLKYYFGGLKNNISISGISFGIGLVINY
jgi:hypothetical protein